MAARLNVAARLDEGQAAVDTIAEYVWACHLLGFFHPDLTRYRYQVRDWYAAEDGLDLRALDAECASLASSAAVAEEALRLQDNHFQSLSQAWQGSAARASTDFLVRHTTSAAQVATGIRGAADTLARLRDNLWQAVDAKVDAAVQIEERQAGQRGTWLAAARAVSTGVGDRAAASELIDAQVKPFVVNDIGEDWLAATRSTTRAVAEAYARAVAALRAVALPVFGVPGELGPVWVPPSAPARTVLASAPDPAPAVGGGVAMPAGFSMSPASAPLPAATMPAGAPAAAPSVGAEPMAPAAARFDPAAPVAAPPSGVGQGLGGGGLPGLGGPPDVGSGLAGTGQQLADLLGGLIGSSAGGSPDSIGDLQADDVEDLDPEVGDDSRDAADDAEQDSEDDGSEDDGTDHSDQDGEIDGDGLAEPDEAVEVTEPQTDSPQPESPLPPPEVPAPVSPPPTVPDSVAEPLAAPAGGTPCEIAADELPQAGP